ncbi:MAG: sigma-70 family RNA polymerase sigma factor, partial [Candidatus Dormibacteraeota bacterium]|nr:sigma-70 family RNA polymerase sigma factor [Candidatus Dormibacteraeota bacterium]
MAVAIQPTDFDVIDQLIAGNSQAIEMLYDRYARLAFGVALKILGERTAAEDVVQEAFVAVWRNAAAFDPARGQIRSWLLRIVRNRAIDRLRANPAYRQSA